MPMPRTHHQNGKKYIGCYFDPKINYDLKIVAAALETSRQQLFQRALEDIIEKNKHFLVDNKDVEQETCSKINIPKGDAGDAIYPDRIDITKFLLNQNICRGIRLDTIHAMNALYNLIDQKIKNGVNIIKINDKLYTKAACISLGTTFHIFNILRKLKLIEVEKYFEINKGLPTNYARTLPINHPR